MMHTHETISPKIERENWSPSSKQSYIYHCYHTTYEDIPYVCRKCASEAVFTKAAQKQSFEVKKHYIWQTRTLCGACNAALYRLKVKNLALHTQWSQDKKNLQRDPIFMGEWLLVLEQFASFGSRMGGSMPDRLKRLLASISTPAMKTPATSKPVAGAHVPPVSPPHSTAG